MRILVTVKNILGTTTGFIQAQDMTPSEAKDMIDVLGENVGKFENMRLVCDEVTIGFSGHLLERSILTFEAVV